MNLVQQFPSFFSDGISTDIQRLRSPRCHCQTPCSRQCAGRGGSRTVGATAANILLRVCCTFEAGARTAPQSSLKRERMKPTIELITVFCADVQRAIIRAELQHEHAKDVLARHLFHAVDRSEGKYARTGIATAVSIICERAAAYDKPAPRPRCAQAAPPTIEF